MHGHLLSYAPTLLSSIVPGMAAAPFVGLSSLAKLFLTSITGHALQYTKWVPRWQRRLALCLHLYCLSRSPILLHPMPLLPPLYRLRGSARPTCCLLKKSSSLVSQRQRHPRKCPRVAGSGPRLFMHRLPWLRPKLTGLSRTNLPNDYPQSLSPGCKSYLVALTSVQDPATTRPPPIQRPPPIPTRENRRVRNADRWAQYRAA